MYLDLRVRLEDVIVIDRGYADVDDTTKTECSEAQIHLLRERLKSNKEQENSGTPGGIYGLEIDETYRIYGPVWVPA